MNHQIYSRWDSDKRQAYAGCLCGWDSRRSAPNDYPSTAGDRHLAEMRAAVRGVVTVKFGRKHYSATCSEHGLICTGTLAEIMAVEHPCPFETGGKTAELLATVT